MPKKLMLSLTLTPLTDRFLMGIFGVRQASKKMTNDDSMFDISNESSDLSPKERIESVETLILLFKSVMIVTIFLYSSYAKQYREKNKNFSDDD
jgi:hypothetical protein